MNPPTNTLVLSEAQRWLGTPYRHQASLRCVGCDCLGLIRGIWRALYGDEPEAMPAYTPDWGEVGGSEHILEAAAWHFLPVETAEAGDMLVFRWRRGNVAKHLGILSSDAGSGRFIHAWEKAGVVETVLAPSWRRRIAAVFRFPEKSSD
jgi:NlpC/P60 family putative phage cell wall peptidase